jgi:hypothetical protein
MTIVYRIEKGAPLTAEELDNNFKDLHKRLEALEQILARLKLPATEPEAK